MIEGYTISTDKARLDIDMIFNYLHMESYWANQIPRAFVEKSIEQSLCFGIYDNNNKQIGFARVISDFATFAYLCDVFILEAHRGKGLSKWLMEMISNDPNLQNLRRWMLATRDAHTLYAQYGFTPLAMPDRIMEITKPNFYASLALD